MNIPPYALWGLLIALGVPVILHFMKVSRLKHTTTVAEVKKRDAETTDWRSGFRGVVVQLRTEMVRGQIPSDWFPTFETSIPILSRIVATMPDGIGPQERTEIVAIVDELCGMSAGEGDQAVHGAQKVLEMLRKLEELTTDAH